MCSLAELETVAHKMGYTAVNITCNTSGNAILKLKINSRFTLFLMISHINWDNSQLDLQQIYTVAKHIESQFWYRLMSQGQHLLQSVYFRKSSHFEVETQYIIHYEFVNLVLGIWGIQHLFLYLVWSLKYKCFSHL